MTHDDYLQLVQQSAAFKTMPIYVQSRVLNAEGDLLNAYARIFEEEFRLIQEAKKRFIEKSEAIVKNMVIKVKKMKKEKLKHDENRSQKEDAETEANLLLQINKI